MYTHLSKSTFLCSACFNSNHNHVRLYHLYHILKYSNVLQMHYLSNQKEQYRPVLWKLLSHAGLHLKMPLVHFLSDAMKLSVSVVHQLVLSRWLLLPPPFVILEMPALIFCN